MTKYPTELKLKVIQDYKNGEGGCKFLAEKYHVKNESIVRRWIKAHEAFGIAGIQRKRQHTVYSRQFKLNAVNLYLTSEKTYQEIAYEVGIANSPLLNRWVLDYREQGESAFSKVPGRPRKEPELPKKNKAKSSQSELCESEQEIVRLQKENLNLRMEVEYLKGLRRLRQEQHKRGNPVWSASSEENSSSPSNNF